MLGFLKHFGLTKAHDAGKKVMETIATWDPEGASEAEIRQIDEQLNEVLKNLASAKSDYNKEKAEADVARLNYEKSIRAAEILQKRVEENPSDVDSANMLNQLITQLETLHPEVEREEREAIEAAEVVAELDELAKMIAEKLKTARSQLESAVRDMKKAEAEVERAKERADRAAVIAGIKEDSSSLNSALSAMRRKADESRQEAAAATTKADILSTPSADKKLADFIESIDTPAAPTSISDRLAALKKK